jgi:HlyD family secretion protein
MEVRVEVLSADAVRIRPGMTVLFKRWGRDEPLEGRVRRVEPAGFSKLSSLGVEEQRVLVICDITSPIDLWRVLGDGYRLEAHFVVWEGKDILQVPTSALFRLGTAWAVFVEDQGRASRRTVSIGQRTGLAAQILSGLAESDRVVAYPDDAIADGTRIRQRP